MTDSECLLPPISEPLSIEEVKTWLKIDGTDEDLLIGSLISSARLTIEAITGLLLIEQTWRFRACFNPIDRIIKLPHRPLVSLSGVQRLDSNDLRRPLALEGFMIENASLGRISVTDKVLASLSTGDRLEIDVVMGFGRSGSLVPAPLLTAMRLLISYWHERRGDDANGVAEPWPPGLNALLLPFREIKI